MKRWAAPLLLAIAAALFARWNTGEAITIRLGFHTFYRVPMVPFILGTFLLGMATMFVMGLRHDRQVRRALAERVTPRATPAIASGIASE